MSLYAERILPLIIDRACSLSGVMQMRERVVPLAKGIVLEVGMGSAINLPLYRQEQVDFIWGLEPSVGMRKKAQANLQQSSIDVRWLDLPGEDIPLVDNSVDTVLLTFTLCTIPDWHTALQQMRRVLKPSGQLLFCEHGLSEDAAVQRWQHRLTPLWRPLAGGCHLNRPIADYLTQAGFSIQSLQCDYVEKTPRFVGYVYSGTATLDHD